MAGDPAGSGPLFAVAADAYDRLMGRYLPTLAVAFADAADVRTGDRVLDVGCGPGGLTTELVRRTGSSAVCAIDPSPPFVAACRARNPGVDVRAGVAEELPWPDGDFDACLASLVIGFMADPAAGVREMRRVTRPGGTVALCFWDLERMPLLATFWRAVREVDPAAPGEAELVGRRRGQQSDLLTAAGLTSVAESELPATAAYADLDDWWSSFTGGAGPVGAQYRRMSPEQQDRVRAHSAALLDRADGPFTLQAYVWCATGRV
jgi:SAM-dependent methyltransferase